VWRIVDDEPAPSATPVGADLVSARGVPTETTPSGFACHPSERSPAGDNVALVSLEGNVENVLPPCHRVAGELFELYILVETVDGLLILDKHALHERIIYEELKTRGPQNTGDTQIQLTPLLIHVTGEEHAALMENMEFFASVGFAYDDFGASSVMIREVPMNLAELDTHAALLAMLGDIMDTRHTVTAEAMDRAVYTLACKMAVRSGEHSAQEELEALVNAYLTRRELDYCPHGRPVAVTLTKRELEKLFRRAN